MSVFERLNAVNVNGHTEKKNGLTYLSWAWAWTEVKKAYPDARYTVYENEKGWCYFTDGRTCWVKTGLTIEGLEHIEYLPVMDFRNKSIPLEQVTSMDVNKAIQRSLTKAAARHGLGLYIYAGEDLPEEETKPAAPAGGLSAQKQALLISLSQKGVFDMDVILARYGVATVAQLTEEQANNIILAVNQAIAEKKARKEKAVDE